MDAMDTMLECLKENIESYVDFPQAGIVFQDIFGAMRKPKVLQVLMYLVRHHAQGLKGKIDCVVGLDSRGFIFGPAMALELEIPFVPVRIFYCSFGNDEINDIYLFFRSEKRENCQDNVQKSLISLNMETQALNCKQTRLIFVKNPMRMVN